MINSQTKSSGFITLTITLIIIILVTVIVLMTGKMLMNEQRSAANNIRYKEAMSAAQAGLDAAMAKLSVDNASRTKLTNTSSIPYYQVTFGSDINIQVGSGTLPCCFFNIGRHFRLFFNSNKYDQCRVSGNIARTSFSWTGCIRDT